MKKKFGCGNKVHVVEEELSKVLWNRNFSKNIYSTTLFLDAVAAVAAAVAAAAAAAAASAAASAACSAAGFAVCIYCAVIGGASRPCKSD